MWPHYTNNSNPHHIHSHQVQQPQHHRHFHHQNVASDPLSVLAQYTTDPSANATAFATASSNSGGGGGNHNHMLEMDRHSYNHYSGSSSSNDYGSSGYYAPRQNQRSDDWERHSSEALASSSHHNHLHYDYYKNDGEESEEEEVEESEEDEELVKINQQHHTEEESEEELPSQQHHHHQVSSHASHSMNSSITSEEFKSIADLLTQFCKVPLLGEFARPVSTLHPELVPAYSKIIKHPMDLSKVCRRFYRKNYYTSLQSIQVDMWRIFSNCILFHSHPSAVKNGYAIPSFISLAMHLRMYFNGLWEEYVIPSDAIDAERDDSRNKRFLSIASTMLSEKCLLKVADALQFFLENRGCVDRLDTPLTDYYKDSPWTMQVRYTGNALRNKCLELAAKLHQQQQQQAQAQPNEIYVLEDLSKDLDNIANQSPAPQILQRRLQRLLGKIVVPIQETNCRGVNQSSIWGCMAAAIWARESSKKRFWPAIVLGILAPTTQEEIWHVQLNLLNESRLPNQLRQDLQVAKRKAELALEKQNALSGGSGDIQSYFLVEFMGKHEFTWVREADIIEQFDPDDDPNLKDKRKSGGGSRPSSSSSSVSDTYTTAVEEGKWALEEFDMQLQDPCGDYSDNEGEEDFSEAMIPKHTSFNLLRRPVSTDDSSVEEDDNDLKHLDKINTDEFQQEREELIATQGLIDFSTEGRKNAKKRALEIRDTRKHIPSSSPVPKKKKKVSSSSITSFRTDEEKVQRKMEKQILLEKKRVEKELKAQKSKKKAASSEKKKKSSSSSTSSHKKTLNVSSAVPIPTPKKKSTAANNLTSKKISDKRHRAEMIVQGYLLKIAQNISKSNETHISIPPKQHELCLAGFMTNPDSFGLLGMALTFRAAANDLPWNDASDPNNMKKPWELIDATKPSSTRERCKLLKQQTRLLEREIKVLEKGHEMRVSFLKEAEEAVKKRYEEAHKLDLEARVLPFGLDRKRKKKPTTPAAEETPPAATPAPSTVKKKKKGPTFTSTPTSAYNDDYEQKDLKLNQSFSPPSIPQVLNAKVNNYEEIEDEVSVTDEAADVIIANNAILAEEESLGDTEVEDDDDEEDDD